MWSSVGRCLRVLKDLEYATAQSTGFVVTAIFFCFYRYQGFLFHIVISLWRVGCTLKA